MLRYLQKCTFLALALLVISCCSYCSSRAVLRVTSEHRDYLNYVGSGSYSNTSIERLFNRLDGYSNQICDMIFENRAFDEALAADFSSTLDFHRKKNSAWFANILPALIAGCANFYQMNDRGVHRVFRILEQLYPEEKDCFTVGFTQYYMMLQEMRCARMVSVDADWRILRAHYEFQELVRNKPEGADAISLLKQLHLNWVVYFDSYPVLSEVVENELSFCKDTEFRHCARAFANFLALPQIGRTELMLGFIHDSKIVPENNKSVGVVFSSNALDWEYTTEPQFDKLIGGARENLALGQKLAVVYQAGDSEDIVVYELAKTDSDELNVSIRCRDNIRWSDVYTLEKRGKPFNTHFDDLLEKHRLRGIPRCHVHGTKDYNDPKKSKKYIEAEKKKKKEERAAQRAKKKT